jgi:hypothetical protein
LNRFGGTTPASSSAASGQSRTPGNPSPCWNLSRWRRLWRALAAGCFSQGAAGFLCRLDPAPELHPLSIHYPGFNDACLVDKGREWKTMHAPRLVDSGMPSDVGAWRG